MAMTLRFRDSFIHCDKVHRGYGGGGGSKRPVGSGGSDTGGGKSSVVTNNRNKTRTGGGTPSRSFHEGRAVVEDQAFSVVLWHVTPKCGVEYFEENVGPSDMLAMPAQVI